MEDRDSPPWAGVSRVVLATPDLEETMRFYGSVLGMRAEEVGPEGRLGEGRECLVRPAHGGGWALHFVEHPDAGRPDPEWRRGVGLVAGPLQHLGLPLPDEAAARGLRARLEEHGVAVAPTRGEGRLRSMRFLAAHDLVVEVSWPREAAQPAGSPPTSREAPALARLG